ncbi:MAG: phage portal protein family protein [Brevinema sp.]
MVNHLNNIKSLQMLRLWRQIPNPDHQFFLRHGISPHKALKNLSYSPEVQSVILARESAVIGDPWEIHGEKEEEVKFIKQMLEQLGINNIFKEIFHALWYGYTVLQHPIEQKDGLWKYLKINSLPSEWFAFDTHYRLIPSNHEDGSPLNTSIGDIHKEVELVQYRSSYNNPYGESLLAKAFWSATWIRGTMDLWISYIDRFGDDSIIGRIDIANEDRKAAMLHAIKEFRGSGAMVIEGTDKIEILKSDKNSSSQLFNDFYTVCTKQINKIFLGHSGSLDSTPGKLGNENNIDIVRQDIMENDKSLIAETLNRLIRHLCTINKFSHVQFKWHKDKLLETSQINRDYKLHQMGIKFSPEYLKKTYDLQNEDINF